MTGKWPQGVRSQCRSWEDKDSLSKFVQLTMNGYGQDDVAKAIDYEA